MTQRMTRLYTVNPRMATILFAIISKKHTTFIISVFIGILVFFAYFFLILVHFHITDALGG
jgi:hypothetical protein